VGRATNADTAEPLTSNATATAEVRVKLLAMRSDRTRQQTIDDAVNAERDPEAWLN
jgi:hypothetical protein